MTSVIYQVLSWPTFLVALLVFGFAPRAVLRLIVLAYGRDDPRRRELLGELYHVPRIEQPFWVVEQLETALSDGLGGRFATRRARRLVPALVQMLMPGGGVMTVHLSLAAGLRRADVQADELYRGIFQALAKHHHIVHCAHEDTQRLAELLLKNGFLVREKPHRVFRGGSWEDRPGGSVVRFQVTWLGRAFRLRC